MQIIADKYRSSRMYASMSTPSFSTILTHCITFDYAIVTSHTKTALDIYIRSRHYMLSGSKIWGSLGTQNGTVSVPVWNDPLQRESQLDFIGVQMATGLLMIKISNVVFKTGNCENINEVECHDSEFRCRDRQKCITVEAMCNGTSECSDSSDEVPPACGEYLSSPQGLVQSSECHIKANHFTKPHDTLLE